MKYLPVAMAICIFCFFGADFLYAQSSVPRFKPLDVETSNPTVKSIAKDQSGFMWFGTENGLNKFDGRHLTIYENIPGDSSSLLHNNINIVFKDQKRRLWIGTAEGVCLYNPIYDRFTRIINKDSIPSSINFPFVTSITDDNRGNIWIGTIGNGLICYHSELKTFQYFKENSADPKGISSNHINDVVSDNYNRIWIATWNGLEVYDTKEGRFRRISSNPKKGKTKYIINDLLIDTSDRLWIGTSGAGLNVIDLSQNSTEIRNAAISSALKSSTQFINSIKEDWRGNIWMGTENGLIQFNPISGTMNQYRHKEGERGLGGNNIRSIFFDENQMLWAGVNRKGIYTSDPKHDKFEIFHRNPLEPKTLSSEDVTGFAQDNQGTVWISTRKGITLFDGQSRSFLGTIQNGQKERALESNHISAIACDQNDNVWAAIWNEGIDLIDNSGKKLKHYDVATIGGVGNNKIYRLRIDSNNDVWAYTVGSGLFLLHRSIDQFVLFSEHFELDSIAHSKYPSSLLRDKNGFIWMTTFNGLFRFKENVEKGLVLDTAYFANSSNGLVSNRFSCSFQDSKNRIWFGTDDKGLNLLEINQNSFKSIQKQDGLPSNTIRDIAEDRMGRIWITTPKGLCIFDPETESLKTYTEADGLNSDNFYFNHLFVAHSGDFYLGGAEGFNIFKPEAIADNELIPELFFTDFRIFDKSVPVGQSGSPLTKHISETDKLVLSYLETSFTIEFVALNYTRPARNQYQYRLLGFDRDWVNAGNKNHASYTNMDAGTYTFDVKGSNNDGVWNEKPITLNIEIRPPIWKTTWAYILYFTLLVLVSFLLIRLLLERAKQAHLLELDEVKLRFFSNISHELRTPLSLILSPIENLLSTTQLNQQVSDRLKLIYKNADVLHRLVNQLMDFTKSEEKKLQLYIRKGNIVQFVSSFMSLFEFEAERRAIQFTFSASDRSLELWFDSDKVEKILRNLISNAFKFTANGGKISIEIDSQSNPFVNKKGGKVKGKFVEILVRDNGVGIPQDQVDRVFDRFYKGPESMNLKSTGIGLSLTKTLVEIHHGFIEVNSISGEQTTFRVLLPMGKGHFKSSDLATSSGEINAPAKSPEPLLAIEKGSVEGKPVKKHKILVVEDNEDLRNYLVSTLTEEYEVRQAESGEEGLEAAYEYLPNLVLSDVMMSNMTGIELCQSLKDDDETNHIPVVLLTAKSTTHEKVEGIASGADAYVTKPFNLTLLKATIRQLIETRQRIYKRFSQDVFIMPKEISSKEADQQFLRKAIDFIHDHLTDADLTVEILAQNLRMSRGSVWRKIKALTGQSVAEFIRTVRLKKSIQFIEEGKYNVSEIAYKVGFNSPAYFIKRFKEQFGKTPKEYLS